MDTTHTTPRAVTPKTITVLCLELGVIIGIPLFLFLLVGIKADQYLHTAPLFMIVSMFVALITSASIIYLKIKKVTSSV